MNTQKAAVDNTHPFWWNPEGTNTVVAKIAHRARRLKILVGGTTSVYIDPLDEDIEPLWLVTWKRRKNRKRSGSAKLTDKEIIVAFGLPQQHRREGPNDKIYIELEYGVQALIAPGKFAVSDRYLNMPGKEDCVSNLSLLVTDDVKEAILDILHLT